jgi:quinol-cytochrome oxidoreductase complex cytochrome b subunit
MSALQQSFKNFMGWMDARLPVTETYEKHMSKYYAPKNFNFWYFFGVLATVVLVNQLLTGIWLTMSYVPTADGAFASVEYIMRDVEYGWMLRYMHSTGASAFFLVVYLHMFRGLAYGSYQKPRELIWILGMLIYVALMAEGFFGYLLPWGNMSFWAGQVIVSLAGAIPFHPHYTIGHDLPAIVAFLFLFCLVMFYIPDGGGYLIEHPNYEPANPLKTPDLIAPVWYYTPFYSMLRAATFPLFGLDAKFWGLVVMAGAIAIPAVLPWLDKSPVKSIRYKGWGSKLFLTIFIIAFFILGYLGVQHPTPGRTLVAQICTAIYFGYFLLMPWYTSVEKTKPVPDRVTMR